PKNYPRNGKGHLKESIQSLLLGLGMIFMIFTSAQAQSDDKIKFVNFENDTCYVDEVISPSFIDVPKSNKVYWKLQQKKRELENLGKSQALAGEANSIKTATINIIFGSGFSQLGANEQAAKDAFRFAADIWETEVVSAVPITIRADFQDFGSSNIIGSNSSPRFINTPNAPPGIVHTLALARAYAGFDFVPDVADGTQTYNLGFDFYFGTDGQAPGSTIDFVTVVLHEIGHSMGIAGFASGGVGVGASFQGSIVPSSWDLFIELGDGTGIFDLPFGSPTQLDALVGGDLFFDGPATRQAFNNNRPQIYAPNPFQGGSSYSHWDEARFPTGTPNSLMTPRLARGEVNRNIGDITRGALKDQGWTLSSGLENPQSIVRFELIRGFGDEVLQEIKEGDVIDVSQYGTSNFAIRAVTDPEEVGSVEMILSGALSRTQVENIAPYALFGDDTNTGTFNGFSFPSGDFNLTANPFSERRLGGERGNSLSVNFQIVNPSSPALRISSLRLMNADTDEPIFNLGEASLIDLNQLPSQNINIQVFTSPEQVGSVVFNLTGPEDHRQIENQSPYALFGDDPRGDFNAGNFLDGGNYVLFVTPFAGKNGTGEEGETLRLELNVINTGKSPGINRLSLININTNQAFPGFEDINQIIDVPQNIAVNATVKADVNGETESVLFSLEGPSGLVERIESVEPLVLFGDNNGNPFPWSPRPQVGQEYNLRVQPYTLNKAEGIQGLNRVIRIRITGNSLSEDSPQITFYPNPSPDQIQLTSKRKSQSGILELYDINGETILVKTWKGALDQQVDLSKIKRGLYMLKVEEDGKYTFKRVLLK
ncbi:MAG: T9SS type A sorting domain-containing protein, partial [Bacteroidota bacterium]